MRLLIAALSFILSVSTAQAKQLTDLYQAVVPAGQSQSAWQQQALAQVLVKVTVNPAVVEQAAIKAELKNAGNYIKTFAAVSSEQGPALKVGLDEQKIQQLLSQNQIAIWGARRPAIVLWLVEQTPESRVFMQGSAHPVLSQLQQQAQAIGFPLELPTASDTYVAPLSQDEVWAGNWLLIEQASLPFNADQSLILLFDQPTAGLHRLTWQGYEQGQLISNELTAASQQELASAFLSSLTTQLASKFAVQLGSQQGQTELELDIEGLTNFVDQVKVQQMLSAMLSVKQVTVLERKADLLKFKVQLAADRGAFVNSLSLERRLQALQSTEPTEPATSATEVPAAAEGTDELFAEMAAEMATEPAAAPTEAESGIFALQVYSELMTPVQYTLAVTLPEDETLDTFYGADTSPVVGYIKHFLTSPSEHRLPLYLFGASGSGKSHLLYAACVQAQELGLTSQLLSLEDFKAWSPRILDQLEELDLVCLDNIQAIAGDISWQVAVFDLYNRMTEQGKALIIVADQAPTELGITLPDLVSRLQACTSFQLRLLGDEDKQKLLQQKARLRGMELPDEVARFLLNRQQRDIRELVQILDLLDKASIVHQRKLTIPFVKDMLSLSH